MRANVMRIARWGIDFAILSAAYWLASQTRFEGEIPAAIFKRLAFAWPYAIDLQYFALAVFNVQRFSWRYVGLPEMRKILMALSASTVVLMAVRVIAGRTMAVFPAAQFFAIPFGVLAANFPLALLGIGGVRVLRRMLAERTESGRRRPEARAVPTMLVGAGEGGVLVVKELRSRPDLGLLPVGFLDDDPGKVGTVVQGVPVVGTTARLAELCHRYGAEQVLLTIARVTGDAVRRLASACEAAGLPVKIIPPLHEIVGGKLNLSRIRQVAIEDLLRREPVQLEMQGIAAFLQGKTVLVTGAGGSIGAEIARQVARFGPRRLVLCERFETALFDIHRELERAAWEVELFPEIADITDRGRMQRLFERFGSIDVVFHAAAHKHVPMMEMHPAEAIKNNVLGTKLVADLAAAHRVRHFVMISTDKAVNPSSVMGATKRVAELYVQGMQAQHPATRFVSVRFGNVLGSNGSVIPIFKAQIAAGGPVTVTHPEMTRYFMTIPEATQLVLQAAALGAGGEVFILDMGEPVRILDLAHDLIRLSGLEPGRDIAIEFTGIRPGEKLFEELATDQERADATRHRKIFIGRVQAADWPELLLAIESLGQHAERADAEGILAALRRVLGEFGGGRVATPAQVIPLRRETR